MEAGIFRVDDTLHRRLEDSVRSIREPAAAQRRLSAAPMTRQPSRGPGEWVRGLVTALSSVGEGRGMVQEASSLPSRAQTRSRQFGGRVDGVSVQTSLRMRNKKPYIGNTLQKTLMLPRQKKISIPNGRRIFGPK